DYRGVFVVPLADILSPFRSPPQASTIGDEAANTSYELRHFCRLCANGNPSALEVLVGIPKEITPEGEALRELLPKFLSKDRCFRAFPGYARQQGKEFRQTPSHRKWKHAAAQVRTLQQLLHLLRTGELSGTYPPEVVAELRAIKEGRSSD